METEDPALGDVELWRRARVGGDGAFGVLFERHSRAVYNHCFARTASWSDAEDVTSLVFISARTWVCRGPGLPNPDSAAQVNKPNDVTIFAYDADGHLLQTL